MKWTRVPVSVRFRTKKMLFFGLVGLIFVTQSFVHRLASAETSSKLQDEMGENGLDLSIDESRPSSGEILDDKLEKNEILDEEPQNEPKNESRAGRTFTWHHHHEDHGLYAGRAVISAASSEPNDLPYKFRDGGGAGSSESSSENEEVERSVGLESDKMVLEDGGSRVKEKKTNNKGDLDHRNDEDENGDNDDDLSRENPFETIDYAEKEWQLMFRAFDLAYDSASSSILQEIVRQTNLFDEIVSGLKPQCRRDIYYLRDSARKHKLWALRMLDSSGKLPSGVTYGRFSSPGDYEECLSVQVNDKLYTSLLSKDKDKSRLVEKYKFHGKYCLLDFRLPLPERPQNKLLGVHDSVLNFTGTEIGQRYPELISKYAGYASIFYEVGYLHGFCLPSSCDVVDLTRSMTRALEGMYIIVNSTVDCEERPAGVSKPIRSSQWISIALMAFVFVNALLASIANYLLPEEIKQQPSQQRRGTLIGALDGGAPGAGKDKKEEELHQEEVEEQEKGEGEGDGEACHGGHETAANNVEPDLQDTLRHLSKLEEARKIDIMRRDASLRDKLTNWSIENRFYADCFSVQKNFERLTKPDPRGLTFVHYTRIVAMALTVVTHTGALGTLQAITKPADASNNEQIFRDLIPQMLANAFTSIQIFFFMAGFMLIISTFPSIKRDKGHISFIEYAVKRAIRLMPGIAATICLNFIWPLLVDGPMLTYFDRMIVVPCETNWWHTMAFLSNFDHGEKMCLRHSYFSASDYQLHIMAFPLLILLYKQPILALFLAALLTISGFVAQIIMTLTKTLIPFIMVDYIDKEAFLNIVHYIHHPVWNHMSAFFYGFIIGYLVVRQIRVNLSERTIKRVWYVMIPAGLISIFAPYFWNHYKRPIFKWQMVLYVIFDRFILLTACAWLSYATMVLARKPAKKLKEQQQQQSNEMKCKLKNGGGAAAACKSPIERVLSKTQMSTQMSAGFEQKPTPVANIVVVAPELGSLNSRTLEGGASSGSLTSLPRQRSSPNLISLQQQQQQDVIGHRLSPHCGRLSRTTSSSNLATIAETSQTRQPEAQKIKHDEVAAGKQQQPAKTRTPAESASSINTLCLVLSRLTFQLYLFNMVVLWIDVNHSKYYWFFSYYFIIFKAAAIYISSAILAMIFFVVMESPCLTLYIAWVKGRAAARAKQSTHLTEKLAEMRIIVPPPIQKLTTTIVVGPADADEDGQMMSKRLDDCAELTSAANNEVASLSFIDYSSSPSTRRSPVVDVAHTVDKLYRACDPAKIESQTRI